jgi:phosphopantothenoylcysteine decarboxylase/phosphopantothenate--cysteine ligase
MARAVEGQLPSADVLIMAAAPADFRPADPAPQKLKKQQHGKSLALTGTPDILKTTAAARKSGAVIVGFALETQDVIANGREKLAEKQLDMIVANDATEAGAGFGVDTNRVTLVLSDGREEHLPLMSKAAVADAILDRVEALLGGR